MPTLSVMTIPVMPNQAVSFAYLVSYSLLCIQSPTSDFCRLLLPPIVLLCLLSLLRLYLVYYVHYIYLVYSVPISFYAYLIGSMHT